MLAREDLFVNRMPYERRDEGVGAVSAVFGSYSESLRRIHCQQIGN